MKFINGDITDVTSGIVCHQVNCQGVMGSGIALAIRNKWPVVYTMYREAYKKGNLTLGNVIFVTIKEGVIVANLCGQDRYGRDSRYTNYYALHGTIQYVSEMREEINKKTGTVVPVYFPNKMGCGLAGGDWNIVIRIIEKYVPDAIIINYTR